MKNQFRTQTSPARTVRSGDLELDRASCRVTLRGAEVALTATVFRLLEFLMSRPEWSTAASSFWTPSGGMTAR